MLLERIMMSRSSGSEDMKTRGQPEGWCANTVTRGKMSEQMLIAQKSREVENWRCRTSIVRIVLAQRGQRHQQKGLGDWCPSKNLED